MVENREKKSSNPDQSQRRQQPSDLIQRRPRLNAEEETRRRNERANELQLKNRSNRIR